ncbi:hypothetical protein G6F42_013145 [Rhizopus arrhizus]|nr:hypothetical protein G6F42_013145 [Rhizopus arrhizus]
MLRKTKYGEYRKAIEMLKEVGEPFLKCAGTNENLKLNDTERRSSGAKVDLTVKSIKYLQDAPILEMSGPIDKTDLKHFLEDRNEIARNMKYILKDILGACPNPSHTLINDLRVDGFQMVNFTFTAWCRLAEAIMFLPMSPSSLYR